MCALQINQIVPAYNCGQEEFYQIALLGWDSYKEHQLVFASKNTKYTVLYGTTQRNAVLAAKAMPDEQQRNSKTTEELIKLGQNDEAALIIWKELEGLVISSFAEEFHIAKLEQAGSTHYEGAAGGNWEEVSALMESGPTFIADNTAALTAGGMPVGFDTDFDAKKDEFDTQYGVFKDMEQDSSEQRDAKIIADNAAHKILTEMFADGQKYFRLQPAIRERFTFVKVLELVSGAGSKTVTLNIAAGGFESVSGGSEQRYCEYGYSSRTGVQRNGSMRPINSHAH
jgi:hypothetical protein